MLHLLSVALTGLVFDGSIGIGSILNAALLVIGFAASWYKSQAKAENQAKELEASLLIIKDLGKQLQMLSLTVERLSTLSEVSEKRVERLERDKD